MGRPLGGVVEGTPMVVRGFGLCLVGCVRLPFPFWGRGHLLCGVLSLGGLVASKFVMLAGVVWGGSW